MDGDDAVSIDAISEAVDVTMASIYYYFRAKSDMFVSALETLLSVAVLTGLAFYVETVLGRLLL